MTPKKKVPHGMQVLMWLVMACGCKAATETLWTPNTGHDGRLLGGLLSLGLMCMNRYYHEVKRSQYIHMEIASASQ